MNINLLTSFAPLIAAYLAQFIRNPKSAKAVQLRNAVQIINDATEAFLAAVPAPKA